MCSKVEKYSEDEVDSKDVEWIEWKESVDHFVAKKQRMERTPCPDNSHIGVFPNQREDPLLPKGFTWGRQKQLYCPPDLLCHNLVNTDKPTLDHEFGYVFCHRGLYDRAQGIVDNSAAAIENGVNHGYYLHELDSFVFDRLDKTIVVHEKGAFRVSAEDKQWKEMTIFEILKMFLVDRKVDLSKLDFTESFEKTDQAVPDLLSTFWKELLHPTGVTLQIDMRDDDFKKLFSYYSYHIFQGTSHRKSLGSHLFRPTMFKGYNHHFKSFDALRDAIEQECITAYGRNYFETEHLHWFPHLMMVIAAEAVMELLKEEYPSYSLPQKGPPFDFSTTPSYEQIYVLAMRHISSFVDIGKNHYNFILEVEYSGLGLGYDVKNDLAWNPLNGERIVTEEVIFEARFDRALIDVTLELKRAHKGLLIASCTRLPDVILPTGNYIAGYLTSKMKPWETEEKGISRHLRTIHGGLNPQSDICRQSRTALTTACAGGHRIIIDLLFQRGGAINFIPRGGSSPLYWSSACGHVSIVQLLLERAVGAAGGVAVAGTSVDWGGSDEHLGSQCGCCDDGCGRCGGEDECMPDCCDDETSDHGEISCCTIMQLAVESVIQRLVIVEITSNHCTCCICLSLASLLFVINFSRIGASACGAATARLSNNCLGNYLTRTRLKPL